MLGIKKTKKQQQPKNNKVSLSKHVVCAYLA